MGLSNSIIVFLYSILFSFTLNAALGRQATDPLITHCSLSISYEKNDVKLEELCTGTLIDESRILTAAHCLQKENQVYFKDVQCGNHKVSVKDIIYNKKFHYKELGQNSDLRAQDYLVLELNERLTLPSPRLVTNLKKWQLLVAQNKCVLMGTDRASWNKRATWTELGDFTFIKNKILEIESHNYSLVEGGDSGGALLCSEESSGMEVWYLLAVISGKSSWNFKNYLTPILAASILSLESISDRSNENVNHFLQSFFLGKNINYYKNKKRLIKPNVDRTYHLKEFSKVIFGDKLRTLVDQKGTIVKIKKIYNDYVLVDIDVISPPESYMCVDRVLCFGKYTDVKVHISDLIL